MGKIRNMKFTAWSHFTLSPIIVQTSREEFGEYNVCARDDHKVAKAESFTVACNVTGIRYVIIKRKKPSRTFWSMVICETVIIGRRSVCKYWSMLHNVLIKGKFLYNALSSPQDRSKHFTLYFPHRPVHSDTISASLGSIQPYATINARRLLVHISTTVYSQVLLYTAS